MKATLTSLVLATALVAGSVQAQQKFTHNDLDYCQSLASLTTAMAKEREQGWTLEEQYQDIADFDIGNASIVWDIRYVAEFVYQFPRLSPSEEGNAIYDLCRE